MTTDGILFQYDTGNAVTLASWQQEGALVTGETVHDKVYQYIPGKTNGIPVWTLANGQALLTVTEQDNKLVYRYKGRFNPSWGDMVWESGFVKTILPLVIPALSRLNSEDLRIISDEQVIPPLDLENDKDTNDGNWQAERQGWLRHNAQDLTTLFWVLLFIILLIERIYTYGLQRIKMPDQKSQHIIHALAGKWSRNNLWASLLNAMALGLVLAALAFFIFHLPVWAVITTGALATVLFYWLRRSKPLTPVELSSFLNRSYPALEESTQLLLIPEQSLSLLQKMQVQKYHPPWQACPSRQPCASH
ncbi:hypothetical protein [Paraflavitalea speifideaquila]|uniref:hypothetical protein n=1 Tax=Paraflavitalea speifideaquila TaxID=3076558 RepID=UPI0028E66022|nr:hypothetical protein [Paraflavitalea speifideiaquila]